jgi:predicted nucleic acid-binding protein
MKGNIFHRIDLCLRLYGAVAWSLGEYFTRYDAGYVAVAAITRAPLLTLDHKLVATARNYCDVVE